MDNPIAEAYVLMLQERKEKAAKDAKLDDGDGMDPVGQGDADIDNDGDTDSSDEYLHKRRKAIKKSISKESVDEVRQLKDPKKEVMVVDKKGKTMVIDKSKQAEYLAKGWGLAEGIEIEDDESEADDTKAKKKVGKTVAKSADPAATNAPSQDDREAAADAPDPSVDPDAEPSVPKEKPAPAPKKAPPKVKKESFDWDQISEMTDEEVDSYIDTLDESQLSDFESEMNEAANAEGDAEQQDKEQLDFIRKHSDNAHIVDRPDADKPAAADATKVSKKRPGDNDTGDKKVKRLKDVRK